MEKSKGFIAEFKAVLIFHCTDNALPHYSVMADAQDPMDKEAALERERQLLYVAMTRARDLLKVTWSGKPSRFLQPLTTTSPKRH